jgi:hypothetical protein
MSLKLKALLAAASALSFFGTSAAAFDQPLKLNEVSVRVAWSSNDQIRQRCGFDRLACATVGSANLPVSMIWTEKPASRRDSQKVCALGHEFLHSLGANHNRR